MRPVNRWWSPDSSARRKAAKRLDRAGQAGPGQRLRGAIAADGPERGPLILASIVIAVAFAWSVAAEFLRPAFVSDLAPEDPGSALSTLWQAHTAIVGLSIPLLVLILEQAQSKTVLATTAGHAMVRDSMIPLTTILSLGSVVEIGVVAVYFDSEGSLLSSLLLAMACLLLIAHGYWRALGLLISPSKLRERSEDVLFQRLQSSIRDAFIESIANEQISRSIRDWQPAQMSREVAASDAWTLVSAPGDGTVTDLDVDRLRQLLVKHVPPLPVADAATDDDGDASTGIEWPRPVESTCGVAVSPVGSRVRRGQPLLAIRVPPGVVPDAQLAQLVTLGPWSPLDKAPFRIELRALRDQILAAIDGSVLGDVEDGLDLYGRLLGRVLELRSDLAAASNSRPPSGWLNLDGSEVEWLDEDLRTFITRAWRVGNSNVLVLLSTSLTRLLDLMRRRLEERAHERILHLADVFYHQSLVTEADIDDRTSSGRAMLIAVRSYGEVPILFEFAETPDVQVVYLTQVFSFLARSVKAALDTDADRVAGAVVEVEELLDGLELHDRGRNPWEISPLRQGFNEFALGYVTALAGYTLLLRSHNKLTDEQARRAMVTLRKPLQRASAINGLLVTLDDRTRRRPWSHWETYLWPDGQSAGTLGELDEWIRVAGVLEIVRRGEDPELERHLSDLDAFEAEHILKRLLEAHTARACDWLLQCYPDHPEPDRLHAGLSNIESARAALRTATLDARAALPIVQEKVERFFGAIVAEWADEDREPIRGNLMITDQSDEPREWLGYNSLHPKDYFTDSQVAAFTTQLGQTIGRGLVRAEIERVLATLDLLPQFESSVAALGKEVDRRLLELEEFGASPHIYVVRSWHAARELVGLEGFGRHQSMSYKGHPVDLVYADHEAACYVVDAGRALTIRRWPAQPTGETGEYVEPSQRLLMSVREIDSAYAGELLSRSPNLRVGEDGEAEQEHDAIRRLRRFVHVRAWTKLDVALAEPLAGAKIRLLDGADPA